MEKYKSNLDISDVPTLQNSRIGPTKRLKDKSGVPNARLGILPNLHSSRLQSGLSQVPHQESQRRESLQLIPVRVCIWSGTKATMRTSRSPTTVMTANGEVQIREEATVYVKQLDSFVKVMLLEETPAVLSLGNSVRTMGFSYHWRGGQNPHLIKNGKKIDCKKSNYVPFVIPGISASSSSTTPSSTSSPSSSQESTSANSDSVSERNRGMMRGELRGDPLHDSTEIEKDISHELSDCQQKFRWNLVDGSTSEKRRGDLMQSSATLPVRLLILQWSRDHTWNRVRVRTVYLRTFRRIRIMTRAENF